MYVDVNNFLANINLIQHAFSILSMANLTSYMYPQQKPVSDGARFDFVVVGAGSAGSVVATRLTEDPSVSVLLIEAGGDPGIESKFPGLNKYLVNSSLDWGQYSVKNEDAYQCLRDYQMPITQGKTLGGTSSINLMYYVRGDPHDFNLWAEMTNDQSWNYYNVLPYFKKSERLEDQTVIDSYYGQFHGTNGYLGVTTLQAKSTTKKYFEAFEEIGYKRVLDTNGNYTLGVTEQMVTAAGGLRQSTANTFLASAKDRPNLFILKETLATKIIVDETKRATGVKVIDKNNNTFVVNANKEVIVSAGTLRSPHLLLLSGIGPKEQLESFDINVVADLPVGQNLQNHFCVNLVYKMGDSAPASPRNPEDNPLPAGISGYRALSQSQTYPDFQILSQVLDIDGYMVFCNYVNSYNKELCEYYYKELKGSEIYLLTIVKKVTRRGAGVVNLNSVDPFDTPAVFVGPYADEADLEDMLSYIDDINRVLNTTSFKSFNAKLVKLPTCAEFEEGSKEYFRCYAQCAVSSYYHFAGTCEMASVVDTRLRVHNVAGLRVVDASIMPVVTAGNTNAPTIMIGEKAADMIKEDNNMSLEVGASDTKCT